MDTKLMNCHNFFKQVKDDYQDDAAVKMQYTIRRWLRSIKVAKKLAQDKQSQAKKNTAANQKPSAGNTIAKGSNVVKGAAVPVKVITPQPPKNNASAIAGGKSSTTDSKQNPVSQQSNVKLNSAQAQSSSKVQRLES